MTKGNNTLYFTYDAAGNPTAMTLNGETTYYYATNLQGDIIAILDDDGEPVVEYTYDAWGNSLGIDPEENNPDAATLAELNPLRYRGYVYDAETGFYYLQSRYYNPEIGRFISADSIDLLGADGSIQSYNLFAYCNNNPIMGCDPSGMSTVGISVGVNLTILLGVSVSIGLFWDDDGNAEWQWSYACPGVGDTHHYGAIDAGVGLSFQYTNRDTIYDLYGDATYLGASGGPSWYVGADAILFDDRNDSGDKFDGVQITGGLGFGADTHIVVSNTKPVGKRNNSRDILTFKEKRLAQL